MPGAPREPGRPEPLKAVGELASENADLYQKVATVVELACERWELVTCTTTTSWRARAGRGWPLTPSR